MMIELDSFEMEKLLENEKPFLWSRALHITGKPEDAEDLLQDTVVKVCKGFGNFKRGTNFRAWTKKIMINAHINKTRHGTMRTLSLDDPNVKFRNDSGNDLHRVPDKYDPDKLFFQYHINEKILSLLDSLPDDNKTIFTLFHFEGYTYRELSRAMKMPLGTVKSRIHRARLFLSEKVGNLQLFDNTVH